MQTSIEIELCDKGKRLDNVLTRYLSSTTRSQVKRWIENGHVTVNSISKKGSYKVKEGDSIEISTPPPQEMTAEPQDIPLDIIYEDSDIVVVNKPAGMVVHPAAGNTDGTLVNALLNHCKDLSGIGGVLRPGIVHRLDKGTSGVIVAAKNDFSHLGLTKQFKARETLKIYLAIVYGNIKNKMGTFDQTIGRHPTHRKKMSTKTRHGRDSVTHWEVVQSFNKQISFVQIRLITGRTHQIRVHFSAHGMPLVGDMLYGGRKTIKRLTDKRYIDAAVKAERPMLHAKSISLMHPRTSEKMTFIAELPEDFQTLLEAFREISS